MHITFLPRFRLTGDGGVTDGGSSGTVSGSEGVWVEVVASEGSGRLMLDIVGTLDSGGESMDSASLLQLGLSHGKLVISARNLEPTTSSAGSRCRSEPMSSVVALSAEQQSRLSE